MSLLMDALRKAEQERKDAAKRIKESDDSLLVDKSVDSAAEKQGGEADETGPHPVFDAETTGPQRTSPDTTIGSSSQELSLAPLDRSSPQYRMAPEQAGEGQDEEEGVDSTPQSASREQAEEPDDIPRDIEFDAVRRGMEAEEEAPQTSMDELEQEEAGPDLDETFHGISIEDEETPEMFEETVRDDDFDSEEFEHKYEETLPGVPALQLAKDIGSDDQPTPVAAQTVFTAGNTTRGRSSGLKWLLIGSGITVILAGSVWYYYYVTPINRDLPSPLVAKGIETVATQVPQSDLRARLEPASGSETADTAETGTASPTQEAPAAGDETAMAGTITTGGASGQPAPAAAAAQATAPTDGAEKAAARNTASVQPSRAAAAMPVTAAGAPASPPPGQASVAETGAVATPETTATDAQQGGVEDLPEAIELSPSLIRISRSKAPDAQGVQLQQAYSAYSKSDYAGAAAKYRQVLEHWPDNRDALLGLGAVAMKNGDKTRALEVYSHLLRIDPRDKLVRGILINLSNTTDTAGSESAIKVMLQDHPDQPFLYFALGNLYASQSHWPEAQQAFFDAYRLDSGNPDYALNLAVSLDHLGHTNAALDYYKTAAQLAQNGNASFEPASLQARINTLDEAARP